MSDSPTADTQKTIDLATTLVEELQATSGWKSEGVVEIHYDSDGVFSLLGQAPSWTRVDSGFGGAKRWT